ncbi:MAG: hypothetical protein M5U01_39270 [Ardenticatenaceae bacterium]|nr:hypothetical protein [Ardenticatenaceae bacterium]
MMPALWQGAMGIVAGAGHAPRWEQPEQFEARPEVFLLEIAG